MESIKVSIIIPVYNTEQYVRAAVESIMRQTLCAIEIIVVNDGSTDRSMHILTELAREDARIRVYEQKNCGLSITRNHGLSHATGEYVYFMDSDDLLEPETLEQCYDLCRRERLDFVFFEGTTFGNDTSIGTLAVQYTPTRGLAQRTYTGCEAMNEQLAQYHYTPSVCLNFIHRSFLKAHKLSFHPGIVHEDQLFTAQLYLLAQRTGFINRPFFRRRLRADSLMTNPFAWRNVEGYLTVAQELLRFAERKDAEGKRTEAKRTEAKAVEMKRTVDHLLAQMLDAAVWQAHVLPVGQRLRLAAICMSRYRRYVRPRTFVVLLVKKVFHLCNNRRVKNSNNA